MGGRRKAGAGGREDREGDEDIYLAASTVLKTTVVHFAELPRGTGASGGSRDERSGIGGTQRGKARREKKKRREERAGE